MGPSRMMQKSRVIINIITNVPMIIIIIIIINRTRPSNVDSRPNYFDSRPIIYVYSTPRYAESTYKSNFLW